MFVLVHYSSLVVLSVGETSLVSAEAAVTAGRVVGVSPLNVTSFSCSHPLRTAARGLSSSQTTLTLLLLWTNR